MGSITTGRRHNITQPLKYSKIALYSLKEEIFWANGQNCFHLINCLGMRLEKREFSRTEIPINCRRVGRASGILAAAAQLQTRDARADVSPPLSPLLLRFPCSLVFSHRWNGWDLRRLMRKFCWFRYVLTDIGAVVGACFIRDRFHFQVNRALIPCFTSLLGKFFFKWNGEELPFVHIGAFVRQ